MQPHKNGNDACENHHHGGECHAECQSAGPTCLKIPQQSCRTKKVGGKDSNEHDDANGVHQDPRTFRRNIARRASSISLGSQPYWCAAFASRAPATNASTAR